MPRKWWTSSFFYFFAAVLFAHIITFSLSWEKSSPHFPKVSVNDSEVIRLKIHHNHKKQIVQSEDPATESLPQENAFLSDKTRSFDRQTVAQAVDTFKKASHGNAQVTNKKKFSKKSKDLKELKLSEVGTAHEYAQMFQPQHDQSSESVRGKENGSAIEEGLSATNDYIEEMNLGDFTQLNTTEFKHYGFYFRIRQKLEQFWGRSIQEKAQALYRSGRTIASQNHITAMVVTLSEKGEILSAEIKTSSGVSELDQAAVESFNQAGPFPNPPKDLLKDGRAVIEWGFVVKT